jgi:heme/copper-type cytochrome/quinol oxidase subunit 4
MKKQDELINEFLLREFQEAWTQYRHIESMRVQYLGFFFTVILGSLGFAITMLKDLSGKNVSLLFFGLLSMIWVLNWLTIFLYTSVRKSGFVLGHYNNVINNIRGRIYSENIELKGIVYERVSENPLMNMRIFSVQYVSETILIMSCILFTIIQIAGYFVSLQTKLLFSWQENIISVYALLMLATLIYVILIPKLQLRKAKNA